MGPSPASRPPAWSQTFTFDAFGNITKSGSISWQPTYSSPANNQYLAGWENVSYDKNGNLLNDTFNTYTWDVYGDLASANGATVTYDAFGRMVENHSGQYQLLYSPGGGPVLAEASGQNLFNALLPLPGGATAVYSSSGLAQYNHADWLGSARLFSSTNRVANAAMAYAPFGEGYAGGLPWIQFTGAGDAWTVADSENQTGSLEDFMFRRYNPTQGRWVSPDPAGLAAVDPTSPQSWNRYAYVQNMPLNSVDPLGLYCPTPPTGMTLQELGIHCSEPGDFSDEFWTGGLNEDVFDDMQLLLGGGLEVNLWGEPVGRYLR
jgi:RHS repeat-associated protein